MEKLNTDNINILNSKKQINMNVITIFWAVFFWNWDYLNRFWIQEIVTKQSNK